MGKPLGQGERTVRPLRSNGNGAGGMPGRPSTLHRAMANRQETTLEL